MKRWWLNNPWQCAFFVATGLLLAQWHGSHAQRADEGDDHQKAMEKKLEIKLRMELSELKQDARRVALELRDNARKVLDERLQDAQAGKISIDSMVNAYKRLLAAELTVATPKQARIEILQNQWLAVRKMEVFVQAKYDAGAVPLFALLEMRCDRLQVEYLLAQATKD